MCSKVISVTYIVKVEVDVPWGFDPSVLMPIVMGTVPYRATYGQSNQYGLPQEQQPIPEGSEGFFCVKFYLRVYFSFQYVQISSGWE